MTLLLTGFLTGLGLIVAIGSQNAFVLRQGLLRQHVTAVVLVCMLGDVLLEGAGVLGMGAVVESHPTAVHVVRVLGAAYLVWFGISSLRSARHAAALNPLEAPPAGLRSTVLQVAALTFLNPHVYLDTLVMIGSLANSHGTDGRWWFYAGSILASLLWFAGLGYGARLLTPLVRRARTWQIMDTVVGIMMFTFAGIMLLT